ncbi:MAG TPA: hypothetical protein VHU15_11445, partial [Stellaceae bacterium]|nr:hypothetical protein [Stellaceae bacterium]
VSTEVLQLDRLDPVACYLELDGERISAVPAFDAPATGANGVTGTLSSRSHGEAILVAKLTPRSVYTGEYEKLCRNAAHRALVIVCTGERAGMGLLNAERFRDPHGAPTIHVSSEASETVLTGAARAASARVVAENRYVPAAARNVVAAIGGSRRASAPVVVMTPRSSWWQSTAERGGGLVCWLESLRALIAAPPGCDVVFTANSGHELGHLGLDDFMARRPGWERPISEGGATWVHFGANIGAADGELSLQSASDDLRQLTETELARAGQAPDFVAPKSLVPSGETRDIHRAGGRYVTLVGSNPFFHLPQDRWPHAVDADAVTRIAAAAAALVVELTR